jgi:ABC-type spermidine/putrescine transport system permease subunit I
MKQYGKLKRLHGMGELKIKTPSDVEVTLTPEEEAQIAREALAERYKNEITSPSYLKSEIWTSVWTAIGTAIGTGIAGYLITRAVEKRSK